MPPAIDPRPVLALLKEGKLSRREIRKQTGVSEATVQRIAANLRYGHYIENEEGELMKRRKPVLRRRSNRCRLDPDIDWSVVLAHFGEFDTGFRLPTPIRASRITPGYLEKKTGVITMRTYEISDLPKVKAALAEKQQVLGVY